MALWEFSLAFDDGTVLGQTVLAEGADEAGAAPAALIVVGDHPGLVLIRPGRAVAADVAARWHEVLGDALPEIVPDTGRLALYARGIKDTSNVHQHATAAPRRFRVNAMLALGLGTIIVGLVAVVLWSRIAP